MKSFTPFVAYLLLTSVTLTSAAPSIRRPSQDPSVYDDPDNGTPVELFTAKSSLGNLASQLAEAAQNANDEIDSYPIDSDQTSYSSIFADWSNFDTVQRIVSRTHCPFC